VATSFLLLVRREVQKLAAEAGNGNVDGDGDGDAPAETAEGAEGGPW
jgi:hypothetical protein